MSSSDEPQDEASSGGEQPREPSEPIPEPEDPGTAIIRRQPTGAVPEPLSDDTRTSIIRRQPTSLQPSDVGESATGIIRPGAMPITPETVRISPGAVRGAVRIPGPPKAPTSATAVAASAVAIIGGWATSVVATGLITGWWRTDRLFCVGVGFLTAIFGAATIAAVTGLLLRRRMGIFLSVVAALLALLIFSGIFIAGAHMAGVVYAFPALPAATIVLALVPATWRWTKPG